MDDLNRPHRDAGEPDGIRRSPDLAQLMSEGNAGVSRIPGKHGMAPAFAKMTVLDDTPARWLVCLPRQSWARTLRFAAGALDGCPWWVWLKSRSIRLFMRRWSAICRLAAGVVK